MDFIVLGGILGALMMVAGSVLRDLLPRRLRIASDETPWVDVRDRRRTVRSALAAGRLLTMAGVVVLLATVLLVLLDTGDTLAFAVVVGLTLLGLTGSVAWVLWYRYQESTGAIQRRQLQLIAARLGPARPAVRAGDRRQPVGQPDAGRTGSRPEARPDRHSASRNTAESGHPRSGPGERPEHEHRRTRDSQVERAGAARRPDRDPARREQALDLQTVAPRKDRPVIRPPNRDPRRQPAQHPNGTEPDPRSNSILPGPRRPEPRRPEARPSEPRPSEPQSRATGRPQR